MPFIQAIPMCVSISVALYQLFSKKLAKAEQLPLSWML